MSNKKTRRRRVVLIVLTMVIAVLATAAIWQKNNLQALISYVSNSQEELEEKIQENDQVIKDAVNAAPDIAIRDITEEERQALRDGALTSEELEDRLTSDDAQRPVTPPEGSAPPKEPASEEEDQPAGEESAKPETGTYQKQLNVLVARVYVLREEYLIALDNLQGEAAAAYKAIPESQRRGQKLADFVSAYLAKGTALEKECDRKMDTIVQALESLIRENNGDLSLVDTVISTYANEKSLKKAWYMSELEKKGLI